MSNDKPAPREWSKWRADIMAHLSGAEDDKKFWSLRTLHELVSFVDLLNVAYAAVCAERDAIANALDPNRSPGGDLEWLAKNLRANAIEAIESLTAAREEIARLLEKYDMQFLVKQVAEMTKERDALRQYGNKDCTAMADEAIKATANTPIEILGFSAAQIDLLTRFYEMQTGKDPHVNICLGSDTQAALLLQERDDLRAEVERLTKLTSGMEDYAVLQRSVQKDHLGLLAEAEAALRGIIEIGKRDMTNPKYDSYFDGARETLARLREKKGGA